jgi:hypothetical protein
MVSLHILSSDPTVSTHMTPTITIPRNVTDAITATTIIPPDIALASLLLGRIDTFVT